MCRFRSVSRDAARGSRDVAQLLLREETDMGIEQIYEKTIRPLPAGERLRLARLILDGIPAEAVADFSDEWSDEDLRDLSVASLSRADASGLADG
jgi:hypothetical protein